MKILKFFPILFLFIFSGCNPDKDSIQPQANDSNANLKMIAANGICDIPIATDISDLAPVLSDYLNCVTPVCEYPSTIPLNLVYDFTTAERAPYTYTSTEISNYANQIQTAANNFLSGTVKNACPTAIISSYTVTVLNITTNGNYQIRVVVYYACCDGGPID